MSKPEKVAKLRREIAEKEKKIKELKQQNQSEIEQVEEELKEKQRKQEGVKLVREIYGGKNKKKNEEVAQQYWG